MTSAPSVALVATAWVAAAAAIGPGTARADHACDAIGEAGWTLMRSEEITGVSDSTPYRSGASGDWFVDRTTTVLPTCNYFNGVGNYSLRSYSLDPVETKAQIAICRGGAEGARVAIPPYSGPCPPK